jgi:serine/threonine-protein kinase
MRDIPARFKPDGRHKGGGMGSVVFCDDSHLDRKVAIKFIIEPRNRRRMLDELRALLKMRSKHVVQVYDIVTDGDDLGIVQEYIDGEDLSESDAPQVSGDAYFKTLWQIASGIADIHEIDVIHRDIKPNNMRVDREGIVKIYDFGLAREVGVNAETKGFVGTYAYAAPELYRSEKVRFTKAVDVYAFGVTARFLVDKTMPSELRTIPPKLDGISFFSGLPFRLPTSVRSILQRCLEEDPQARPDMSDVRDELARHLLKDKHQALVVFGDESSFLNSANREVILDLPGIGRLKIEYDGLYFRVVEVSGEVFINNRLAKVGSSLPGSCVVALGAPDRRNRKFITFDLSNPEIVL